MDFETLVLQRAAHLGLSYQRRDANLSLLWTSFANYDRIMTFHGGNNWRVRDALLDLATAAYLFATKGDTKTTYVPHGRTKDEFFTTLEPEITIINCHLQITYAVAEIALGLFLPYTSLAHCWHRSQHLFLLCEYQYIAMVKETRK